MSDETNLEDELRAGLQRRADDVDTTVDLLGPATEAGRGRRRRAWVVGTVGLAAAALVTVAVVQSVDTDTGADGTPPVADNRRPSRCRPSGAPRPGTACRSRCRPTGRGGPGRSSPEASSAVADPMARSPTSAAPSHRVTCAKEWSEESTPQADYVWFDAPPVSNGDLGGGYFRGTVDIDGTSVTIATDNQALGLRIQDSVRPVEGCVASLPSAPTVDTMLVEGLRDPTWRRCARTARRRARATTWSTRPRSTRRPRRHTHAEVYAGQRDYAESSARTTSSVCSSPSPATTRSAAPR